MALSPMPSVALSPLPSAPISNGTKRFRFTSQFDLGVLKPVMAVGAHLAPWGKTQSFFEETFKAFAISAEFRATKGLALPTRKTLSDRFRKLAADREADNSRTIAVSGIVEVYGDKQQLLDDMLLEMKEKSEGERVEKDKKKEDDVRILEAGENMRDFAVKRQRKKRNYSSPGAHDRESLSHKDEIQGIKREIESRSALDAAQLKLQEERLTIEKKRDERDVSHQQWTQELEGRRVEVEERRTNLDEKRFIAEERARQDRKQTDFLANEERKALIGVLGSMENKLA